MRNGGVSEGAYASLNCAYGTGDHPANVSENLHRIAHTLKGSAGYMGAKRVVLQCQEIEVLSCAQHDADLHTRRLLTSVGAQSRR